MALPTPQRKPEGQYHHGDLKKALLAAALDIVESSGVEALTLRAVAAKLGVSHAAPVYHFRTKADLVSALAEQGFQLFADALEASAEGPDEGRLLRVGRAYLSFARQHPNHYRVMFGPELVGLVVPSAGFSAASERALSVLRLSAGDPPEAGWLGERALFAWSLVHGLVTLRTGPLLCNLPADQTQALEDLMARTLSLVVPVLNALPRATY